MRRALRGLLAYVREPTAGYCRLNGSTPLQNGCKLPIGCRTALQRFNRYL
jgi:hypothetical protein